MSPTLLTLHQIHKFYGNEQEILDYLFESSYLFKQSGFSQQGASMGNAREVKGSRNAYQITSQEQDLCG